MVSELAIYHSSCVLKIIATCMPRSIIAIVKTVHAY